VRRLRTALLHLDPVTGAIADNRRLIEAGVRSAAARGAQYVLTPELAVCGYEFGAVIGTAWIEPQPVLKVDVSEITVEDQGIV
jgi:N-carbamoylputrescine amidase